MCKKSELHECPTCTHSKLLVGDKTGTEVTANEEEGQTEAVESEGEIEAEEREAEGTATSTSTSARNRFECQSVCLSLYQKLPSIIKEKTSAKKQKKRKSICVIILHVFASKFACIGEWVCMHIYMYVRDVCVGIPLTWLYLHCEFRQRSF